MLCALFGVWCAIAPATPPPPRPAYFAAVMIEVPPCPPGSDDMFVQRFIDEAATLRLYVAPASDATAWSTEGAEVGIDLAHSGICRLARGLMLRPYVSIVNGYFESARSFEIDVPK